MGDHLMFYVNDNMVISSGNVLIKRKDNEFNSLKELEKKIKFHESDNNNFFRSGKKDSWRKILSVNQARVIEKEFEKEMRELNYL